MTPSFHPRLVNGPFDDPGLFVPFLFEKRAFILDLGDIYSLSARDILKITHVFITHTHIDHFTGFDRLLRLVLGREKDLYLFGPEGFLKNVEGKLAGYTWNLVKNFDNRLNLHVTEVHPDHMITRQYLCQNRFIPTTETESDAGKKPFSGTLVKEPALSVSAAILDHGIPCLGFTMKERFHVNIKKDSLLDLGLKPGPWLKEFKQALYDNKPLDSRFEVKFKEGNTKKKSFVLCDLKNRIALITPGQKVTYIADAVYSKSNVNKILELANETDYLFIESAFLEKEREIAKKKYHLTAFQAGTIGGLAKARQFTLFHFSPRYADQEHLMQNEAMAAYNASLTRTNRNRKVS
jgi:ribonuclease Z